MHATTTSRSRFFAKETGYGFSFTTPDDPVASLAVSTTPRDRQAIGAPKLADGTRPR